MTPRSFLTLSLLIIILLASCAPAESPAPLQPEAPVQPAPMTEAPQSPDPVVAEALPDATEVVPTDEAVAEPEFVSRGPDLEATDPATVSLTSGNLQLVEFFRYT